MAPAVTFSRASRSRTNLHAREVPVVWLGAAGGMETRLVPQHGLRIETIAIGGLRGKGIATALLMPVAASARPPRRARDHEAPCAAQRALLGGYAAGPGGIAARLREDPADGARAEPDRRRDQSSARALRCSAC